MNPKILSKISALNQLPNFRFDECTGWTVTFYNKMESVLKMHWQLDLFPTKKIKEWINGSK